MSELARQIEALRREIHAVTRGSDISGSLYDYTNQAWVVDGVYTACGHPEGMGCRCYGKLHAGEAADMVRIRKENS